MLEQINQGVSGMSLKEMLEAEKSYHLQEMRNAQYELLRKYKIEETNYSITDFIEALDAMNQAHASYAMAFQQLDNGNTSTAESILSSIPTEYNFEENQLSDHDDYLEYFDVVKQMEQNNTRVENLNTNQVEILENLAFEIENYANVYARNMLNRYYRDNPLPEYMLPDDPNKSSEINNPGNKTERKQKVKVYPNPAKDYFTVEIKDKYSTESTLVTVIDKMGRTVKQMSFTGNVNTISVSNLKKGTYIIQIVRNDEILKQKISILE